KYSRVLWRSPGRSRTGAIAARAAATGELRIRRRRPHSRLSPHASAVAARLNVGIKVCQTVFHAAADHYERGTGWASGTGFQPPALQGANRHIQQPRCRNLADQGDVVESQIAVSHNGLRTIMLRVH